jgi:hypothetical protein
MCQYVILLDSAFELSVWQFSSLTHVQNLALIYKILSFQLDEQDVIPVLFRLYTCLHIAVILDRKAVLPGRGAGTSARGARELRNCIPALFGPV